MQILGFQKTTLLDYPGKVAATIFTGGCNFRCPFCQNGDLILRPDCIPPISEEEILSVLKKRRGILTGVCITGGEPTLQADLPDFISRVRALGYSVKLDTNGYRPDVLAELISSGLLSMIAMDIKTSLRHYPLVAGSESMDVSNIEKSAFLIRNSKIPYEFRTTVVKELHCLQDFEEIGQWISGAESFFLQSFEDSDGVICPGYHSCSKEELTSYLSTVKKYIPNAALRGVD